MDLAAALSGPEFAKDGTTFHLALSIEQDGVFTSNSVVPFEVAAGGPIDSTPARNPRHAKIVTTLVVGAFAITGALAWYLMVS